MNDIICPNVNCGYKGPPKCTERGSVLVGMFLLCLMILPGILYFIIRSGWRYSCPQCGLQISAEN